MTLECTKSPVPMQQEWGLLASLSIFSVSALSCCDVNTIILSFLQISTDPPEYADTAQVQLTQLMVGAPFTLNCTPTAANPPVGTVSIAVDESPVTTGDTLTVTDNVLTIPSVQRSHSGNYSCTAINTFGSAAIYHNLLVVGVCQCSLSVS